MFIDFLHRFVIDHINCCYFRLTKYSFGENQSCEAKGLIRKSQPLVGKDVGEFDWHDVVVFQRCEKYKMSSKMAEIVGCRLWNHMGFYYTLH